MPKIRSAVLVGAILALVALYHLGGLCALAEQQITDLNHAPLRVQLQTPLKPEAEGTFRAILTENYVYREQILPAGTVFEGHVERVREARPLRQAGYIMLSVDEVTFPSGEIVRFDGPEDWQGLSEEKLKAPKTGSWKRDFWKYRLPMTAVSLGTSIPLRVATNLDWYVITPISTGARMVTGTGLEFAYDDHDTATKKIAWGIYRGTGIPTLKNTVSRGSKPPSYEAGENIEIELHPEGLERLFLRNIAKSLPEPPRLIEPY